MGYNKIMDSNFLSLLVHPVYKTPLQYDAATQQLTDTAHNDHFVIREGVPILLSNSAPLNATNNAAERFNYKEHYQKDAETYDYFKTTENKVEHEEHERLRKYILAAIPASAKNVLDVGCGGGWLAAALKNSGRQVISMDISDINPIKSVKNTPAPQHSGLVADVFELPIKDGSIDCIVASEIIEHVTDPGKFLGSLFAALRPGGKIIVTTPYNERIPESLCIHCNQLTPHNAHIHSFTEQSIRRFAPQQAAGLATQIFNNKILVRTGLQRLLRFLPAGIYKVVDNLANSVTRKRAYRLMLTIQK